VTALAAAPIGALVFALDGSRGPGLEPAHRSARGWPGRARRRSGRFRRGGASSSQTDGMESRDGAPPQPWPSPAR
jgi:hypothetical protein